MDAGAGEQFMATRPYAGAIMEPDSRKIFSILQGYSDHLNLLDPDPNPEAPDDSYALEYVYGYRCADTR